jgi:hypothetical protein
MIWGARAVGQAMRSLRSAWRLLATVVAVAMLVPLVLGPALAPVARTLALGGPNAHACSCGMKPGTCGCPECEREARGDGHLPDAQDVLGSCDDRGPRSLGAGLPPAVEPARLALLSPPVVGRLSPPAPEPRPVSLTDAPPTPPPRSTTV